MMSATIYQPDALSAGVCTLARVQSVLPDPLLCGSTVLRGCTWHTGASAAHYALCCNKIGVLPCMHRRASSFLTVCVFARLWQGAFVDAGVYGSRLLWGSDPGMGTGEQCLLQCCAPKALTCEMVLFLQFCTCQCGFLVLHPV